MFSILFLCMQMGWKKWALTGAHASVVVSLLWWVVSSVFKPENPMSAQLIDFAFGHCSRHYVALVLRVRGTKRDLYHQVGACAEMCFHGWMASLIQPVQELNAEIMVIPFITQPALLRTPVHCQHISATLFLEVEFLACTHRFPAHDACRAPLGFTTE